MLAKSGESSHAVGERDPDAQFASLGHPRDGLLAIQKSGVKSFGWMISRIGRDLMAGANIPQVDSCYLLIRLQAPEP